MMTPAEKRLFFFCSCFHFARHFTLAALMPGSAEERLSGLAYRRRRFGVPVLRRTAEGILAVARLMASSCSEEVRATDNSLEG